MDAMILEEFLHTTRAGPARAVFAVELALLGCLSVATGLVLDTLNRRSRELMILLADQLIERSIRK